MGVRDAVEAAPVGDKSLLELTLAWEELAPGEKEAAERLRVFLVTWDPFDWLSGRELFFAATNGGDNWEIVLYVPLWNLKTMAVASEMAMAAVLGHLARAAVRVASRYRDEIARGRYPRLVREGSAPGLSSAPIADLEVAVPQVAMVSDAWEPMGLGAIQDLGQDAFGPSTSTGHWWSLRRTPIPKQAARRVRAGASGSPPISTTIAPGCVRGMRWKLGRSLELTDRNSTTFAARDDDRSTRAAIATGGCG